MQHSAGTTPHSQQSSAGHGHVARYVSVITSKGVTGQIKTTDSIKTINPQGRQMITLPGRVLAGSNPINVNIRRVPPAASNPSTSNRPHVNIISSPQQISYGNAQQQFSSDTNNDNVYSNGSPSSSYQTFGEDASLMFNQQQQNNNGNGFFVESTPPSIGSQVSVTTSPHPSNLGNDVGAGSSGGSSSQNPGQIGQIVSSPGGSTYLLQSNNANSHDNGMLALPLPQNRASPATVSHFRREPKTVQWLVDHFENADGVSLPRALMYSHYLLHCREQRLDPVNAASFGKLVRSVFVGLRTRRLGTRGNSKYHYYGIRIKPNSPLNALQDEISCMTMRYHQTVDSKNRGGSGGKLMKSQHHHHHHRDHHQAHMSITEQVEQEAQQHQQFLGDATQALPDLDPIQILSHDLPLPDNVTHEDLLTLEDLYRDHCANILDAIVNLQFSAIESIWYTFWRVDEVSMIGGGPSSASNSVSQDGGGLTTTRDELEIKLPRQKFMSMCMMGQVQRWVKDSDHMIYQSLVEVLIPDVLRPIPSDLTQAIRNFAKGLEGTLTKVLKKTQLPEDLVMMKTAAVSAFSQILRRYTSLNHLAQAARAVLNNANQINQMLSDLNRVDFNNIQEQASWVCQCDENSVREFEIDFKNALSEQRTLEQWADWLESVVNKVLQQVDDTESITRVARQFLLKWCFYSSLVIRDLTLRSAASFGSFHLIRLLYDEYMFYLVEHRVAQATGETTIAIMNDFTQCANATTATSSTIPLMIQPPQIANNSSSSSTATFVASAPVASVNVSIVKTQDKAIKRTATVTMINDSNSRPTAVITNTNNGAGDQQPQQKVTKLDAISKISPLITIAAPATVTSRVASNPTEP